MSETTTIAAEPRERAGKGSSRAARRAGQIPAVIYGNKKDPVLITLSRNEIVRMLNRGGFMTQSYEIDVAGAAEKVLPRDLQVHPVSDEPLHIDFLRLGRNTRITIEVPVRFVGEEESVGLRRGGVLNVVRHTIELNCAATEIPEAIEVDLSELDINDSVHVSAISFPDSAELTITDRDFTIATIAAPMAEEVEEVEEVEGEGGIEGEDGEGAAEGDGDAPTESEE